MYGNKLIKLIFMFFHSLWSYHAEAEYKMERGMNAHYGNPPTKKKEKEKKKYPMYPFVKGNIFW